MLKSWRCIRGLRRRAGFAWCASAGQRSRSADFPGQLRQIFSNLVRNAAEAAPQGTEVVVRVRSICRHGREGHARHNTRSGNGHSLDVRRQIFDPFFTTKELKGSGLGLWVSKNLVMNHHGTIRFRTSTREGASGTTFEVFLPVGGMAVNGFQSDAA